MLVSSLVFAFWALAAQVSSSPTVPDDLAAAKALYASANYEEALTRLSPADPGSSPDEFDQYRALCQLALGRTADAQRSLEQLVGRRPLFKMSDSDVSPRLVAMFHDVRKRLLPAAARRLYARAKTDFEEKSYAAASAQFKELLVLLADEDLAGDAAALSDLKLLGEGFSRLADVELAAAAKAEAASAAKSPNGPPPATPGPAAPGPPSVRIYSEADPEVTPPVDVARSFPAWHPPNAIAQRMTYRGVLRVVIDERGRVESVALVQAVSDAYDSLLLTAAKDWQFRPALKQGQAVKYLKMYPFTLSPRSPR
jgi:TonB family protein